MSDELTGIFDTIDPSDFSPYRGRDAFDRFVTQNLETVRISWLAAEGNINPVAILATADEQWSYTPTDDETLGQYMQRLRAEAGRLGATWLFISRKTLVGAYQRPMGQVADVTDPESLQKSIESGAMSEGVFYFAERFEGGDRDTRHGLMRSEGERLGSLVEGHPQYQTVAFFADILH